MGKIERALRKFSQVTLVVRLWHLAQVALPFGIAAYTAFAGWTDGLSRAQVIAYALLAFAATLLCVTQLRSLLGVPLTVASRENFAYGLHYANVTIGYEPTNQLAALQIGVMLLNSARAPLRFQVERMDVIVGTTTLPNKIFLNSGGVIAMMGSRHYRDAPLPLSAVTPLIGGKHKGSVELSILYGPVDEVPVRRMKFKLQIEVTLHSDSAHIVDLLQSEEDHPYFG